MTNLAEMDPTRARRARADAIREADDVRLPFLSYWNYGPCAYHSEPTPSCEYRACGGGLWAHQRVGVAWLYAREVGLLADDTGTGKTNQIYALLALLKERGELTRRAVIVCQTPAALQWLREGHRWVPRMHVTAALSGMTRRQRIEAYSSNWDVLVIGYHMALRDREMLDRLAPGVLVVDDVDPLLNHETATHKALVHLARHASRRIVVNATSIQIRLQQLHAALAITDGHEVFGSLTAFETRYVRQEPITIWNHKSGRKLRRLRTTGYKHVDELRERVAPMFLRRRAQDLNDVNMPEVMPPTEVWLELHPEQRRRYEELRRDTLRILTTEGENVKRVTALSRITYGQQVCAGLPALRITRPVQRRQLDGTVRVEDELVGHEVDGPEKSVKLDWLMERLETEWRAEKLVVFIKNVGLVEALESRLDDVHVGHATIRGGQTAAERQEEIDRFWKRDECQVMIGTSAIERSLNLQVANRLVFVDTHLNPARMTQIVGRIRRGGSRHSHVYVYNLLAVDTQEESYMAVLETRQALADYVFDDVSELFEQLEPSKLLELIGRPRTRRT